MSSKKSKSNNNQKSKHKNTSAVFMIKPKNRSNECTIQYRGILRETEKLGDEIVELDKPMHPDSIVAGKHAIPINNIGSFEMIGRIYRSNIVGSHIVVSKRYPLMLLNIHYDKPMVSGALLQLYFSIDMDSDEKKAIKDTKQYVNLNFSGKWVRHLECDDEFIENYDRFLVEILEKDGATKFYKSEDPHIVALRNTMTDEEIVDWLNNYVETERVFYDDLMNEKDMKFESIRKTRDYFINLCSSEKFYKFLEIAIKCRDIYRRKEKGYSENDNVYVVPKNIIKLDDIQKQLIENDELIIDED
jgi:hypothetical protein